MNNLDKNGFNLIEAYEEKNFDVLSLVSDTPFTQGFFYGEWQKEFGRSVRRFKIESAEGVMAFFQVIKFTLPFGLSYLYIPHGPIITQDLEKDFWTFFRECLFKLCSEEKAIFARFDFFPPEGLFGRAGPPGNTPSIFYSAPIWTHRSAVFQPCFEWLVDLNSDISVLLNKMHPKTRYNIGLAERKGVQSKIINVTEMQNYFEDFYNLMLQTAARGGFALHPKEYYQAIFDCTVKDKNAFLVVTGTESKVLVINFVLIFGKTATFVFTGSSDELRNFKATYLSRWKGIEEIKRRGCSSVSFGGFGKDKNYTDWKGISDFKQQFMEGNILEYSAPIDLICRPFLYKLWLLRKFVKSTSA